MLNLFVKSFSGGPGTVSNYVYPLWLCLLARVKTAISYERVLFPKYHCFKYGEPEISINQKRKEKFNAVLDSNKNLLALCLSFTSFAHTRPHSTSATIIGWAVFYCLVAAVFRISSGNRATESPPF